LITLSLSSFGQTFTLDDSVFQARATLITYQIKFEFDKPVIRQESFTFLDSVVFFLTKNSGLVIEVGNHTDSRVSSEYSQCLSCNRAKAIRNYLVEKGIAPERIVDRGYQDEMLLIPDSEIYSKTDKNEVERLHQINRRTEFTILRNDFAHGN
jgi:outer membrane protein OmpA-like peptidoglycan-associated protein